ncbi:heterokaryon incompatibility protein-domain-containing protein [Trametes gibbosa]|nr:heterokaryon incompatibility protein-domain-containing protein [Trametes gibbosa]
MPRFLDTRTGEFVWIAVVDATPYAILSHTWRALHEGGEQTYDDVLKLQSSCRASDAGRTEDDPPPPLSDTIFSHLDLSAKIRGICEVAREAGYRLVWIDSCCIDKRSSAELSEAINSMYALYRDADVCYVYLADVPEGTDPRAKDSPFQKSKWHKRGWTLQELIAPTHVVFLYAEWTFLGTKMGLASTLEKVTGVDVPILTGREPLSSASVAKRMSWAATRQTTRVEDRAYSLLGIFGVHMSPIYGEGTNAFLRLQEEIIKHIPDQSIFAWGWSHTSHSANICYTFRGAPYHTQPGLLACSPEAFEDASDLIPIAAADFVTLSAMPSVSAPPPLHCVFTPQGARIALMQIPFALLPRTAQVKLEDDRAHCTDCRQLMARRPTRTLALLRCQDGAGNLIALPLHCEEEDVGRADNALVGIRTVCSDWRHQSVRVVRLTVDMLRVLNAAPALIEVCILRHYEAPHKPKSQRKWFSRSFIGRSHLLHGSSGEGPVFRLAPYCEEGLRAVGFTLAPLDCQWSEPKGEAILTTTLEHICSQPPPRADYTARGPSIRIQLLPAGEQDCTALFSIHRPGSLGPALGSTHSSASQTPRPRARPSNNTYDAPCVVTNPEYPQTSTSTLVFNTCASSRVVAEAEFVIPDDYPDRTDRYELKSLSTRVLRLKLERSLLSAYNYEATDMLFSIELSEPFTRAVKNIRTSLNNTQASKSTAPFPTYSSKVSLFARFLLVQSCVRVAA